AESSRMRRLQDRAQAESPGSRAAFIPELNGLLQVYPVDYDLKSLARVTDPAWIGDRIGRALSDRSIAVSGQPGLIRYKPERKALIRYDLDHAPYDRLYGKLHADDRGVHLAVWTTALIDAGVATPPVVVSLPERQFIAHAEAVGLPLAALRGSAGYARWMEPLAGSMRELQQVELPGLRSHRLADEIAAVKETARFLGTIAPRLAIRLDRVTNDIAARLSGVSDLLHTTHGDFYDDQAVVSGSCLALIDLDEMRLAHPAIDAGNMLAHLISGQDRGDDVAGAAAAFREAVLTRDPALAPNLAAFEAAALLRLAPGPFRRLEPDWPEGIARILTLAEKCLAGTRSTHPPNGRGLANDPLLPNLPQVMDRTTIARHLADHGVTTPIVGVELVRHKVGRRAIVRYDLGGGSSFYGKTFASERGPRVFRIAQRVAEAWAFGPDVALPAPVAFVPECSLLIQRAVAGSPVEMALREGDERLARRIAQALHRFHGSGLDLGRTHDLSKELAPLTMRAGNVVSACPDLADRTRALHERLLIFAGHPCQWRNCPIHRDFYHDQVLVEGDRLAVLDLDDAAMSEPAVDIANFAVHLRLLGFQHPEDSAALEWVEAAFIESAIELDQALDHTLLPYLMATTMLRLAGIHVSRANGRQVAWQLLKAAEEALDTIPACPIGDVSHSPTVRQ
ncbi:MAG: phosphotransferase, partial [Chloroflexota bacterium]|nr:phosphotransferase [Chloroflexota bacterium]